MRQRFFARIRLACAAVALIVFTVGVQGDTQGPPRQVQLWIIGVPEFSIDLYNGDALKIAIEARCREVDTFFRARLKNNLSTHVNCTKETTTKQIIQGLFEYDIPHASERTLTLVFMMSHGEVARFENDVQKTDVEFIASDTTADDPHDENDVRRQKTSVLVASSLLPQLDHAKAGATILMFLDTCHAGAAASASAAISAALRAQAGVRGLVMASSLPDATAYNALFTQALLAKFESRDCLNQDTLPDDIQKAIGALVPLKPGEGIPEVLEQYNGPLCLGNFGRDRRLVFLYGGQSAAVHPYHYVLKEQRLAGLSSILEKNLRFAYQPIPLDAKKYHMTVTQGGQPVLDEDLDLTTSESIAIWLDDTAKASPPAVSRFVRFMAADAERAGASPHETARLTKLAAGVSAIASPTSLGWFLPQGAEAYMTANFPELSVDDPMVKRLHPWDTTEPSQKAYALKGDGDFVGAGHLYQVMASSSTDPKERASLAKEAYYAYAAVRNDAAAKEVQKQFKLLASDLPSGLVTGKNVDTTQAVNLLRSLGIEIAVRPIAPTTLRQPG